MSVNVKPPELICLQLWFPTLMYMLSIPNCKKNHSAFTLNNVWHPYQTFSTKWSTKSMNLLPFLWIPFLNCPYFELFKFLYI